VGDAVNRSPVGHASHRGNTVMVIDGLEATRARKLRWQIEMIRAVGALRREQAVA
jgi:hypothetical protein